MIKRQLFSVLKRAYILYGYVFTIVMLGVLFTQPSTRPLHIQLGIGFGLMVICYGLLLGSKRGTWKRTVLMILMALCLIGEIVVMTNAAIMP